MTAVFRSSIVRGKFPVPLAPYVPATYLTCSVSGSFRPTKSILSWPLRLKEQRQRTRATWLDGFLSDAPARAVIAGTVWNGNGTKQGFAGAIGLAECLGLCCVFSVVSVQTLYQLISVLVEREYSDQA